MFHKLINIVFVKFHFAARRSSLFIFFQTDIKIEIFLSDYLRNCHSHGFGIIVKLIIMNHKEKWTMNI